MRLFLSSLTAFVLLLLFVTIGAAQSLVINEVLASNSFTNADIDGDYEDWIELRNNGSTVVSLSGYALSDDSLLLQKWVFPNINIAAGQHLLVWASGKNRVVTSAPLHTNFKIESNGEKLFLTSPSGSIVDTVYSQEVPENISYGRKPNGTGPFMFFDIPTPGANNTTTGYTGVLSAPDFSVPSGFYTSSFPLTLSTTQTGVTIYYTLDGSEPNPAYLNGKTYTYRNVHEEEDGESVGPLLTQSFKSLQYSNTPITIVDRTTQNNKISMISSSFHNSPYYLPSQKIYKGTVVKAKCVKNGALSSKTVTRNYFISPLGVNRFSLPVISISVDEDKFFDYNNGIYVAGIDFTNWRAGTSETAGGQSDANYTRNGDQWEVPGNFSYFVNGEEKINQKIGFQINGNYSRAKTMKALRLYARDTYSKNSLDYNFFNNGNDSFKRIILRNSGNDAYETYFRDAMTQLIVRHLPFETQDYEPAVSFLNGEYWGMINLRERYDRFYLNYKYNVPQDSIDLLEGRASNSEDLVEGDAVHYFAMLNYVKTNNLATQSVFDNVATRMDIENFTDYQISEIYTANDDWPQNNISYWRKRTSSYQPNAPYGHDGRWRWMMYDTDGGFGLFEDNDFNLLNKALTFTSSSNGGENWTVLLKNLVKNTNYKHYFINRFADLLNTTFLPNRVIGVIDSLQSNIAPEVQEHIIRWSKPSTLANWNTEVGKLRTFANVRPGFQRTHIRTQFALTGNYNLTTNVSSASQGYVKVNTIDILPTTPGVAANPYPWTGVYFNAVPITLIGKPKPGYMFSHWSGASTSTNDTITLSPSAATSVTAHFELDPNAPPQPIYFFVFDGNVPNNTPLQNLDATFEVSTLHNGSLSYQSSLAGYPFTELDPLWRKASMERRNNATNINYRSTANNNIDFSVADVKGMQIRQPFTGSGGENTMVFDLPSTGFKNLIFSFAAINEGAADALEVSYSVSNPTQWVTTNLSLTTFPLSITYQLYTINFGSITVVNNNPDFKVRIRFSGSDMSVDLGNRVTFNNVSLEGQIQTGNFNQSITIANIPDKTTVAAPFLISATASSGLPVSFSIVSGPATISGSTITLTGAEGAVMVKASQGGNSQFNAAQDVFRTFQVTKIGQTITFNTIPDKLVDSPPFQITASASSGLPVSFSLLSGPATLVGNTITLTGVEGTVIVKALQLGNNQYQAASEVTRSFNVGRASQTINFPVIGDKLTTAPPVILNATASSGLPITYSLISGPAILANNIITLTGAEGQVVVTASQPGNTSYFAAVSVTRSFNVAKAVQTITFPVIPNQLTNALPITLNATTSSGLPVIYTLVSGPVSLFGNVLTIWGSVGTVVVTASQPGNTQYAAAPNVTISFNVTKIDQTITFPAIDSQVPTAPPIFLAAFASSGLPINYAIVSGPAILQGNMLTLTSAEGTVIVSATQIGNSLYNSVTVSNSFTVARLTQTITFSSIPSQLTTSPAFNLNATSSSGLPVSYLLVSGPAFVNGNQVTLLGNAGTVSILAFQSGNTNYQAANSVTRTFTVSQVSQTITFAAVPNQFVNSPPIPLQATASSGLSISYNISGPAFVSNNDLVLTGLVGTVTVTATQTGNGQYGAAAQVVRSFEVTKVPQSITFNPISNQMLTALPFELVAIANSGLTVAFEVVSGPATVNGSLLTLTGQAGTVVVKAIQTGNGIYAGAQEITRSFEVNKLFQAITFNSIDPQNSGATPIPLVATASSGLTVSFVLVSGPATLSGSVLTLTGAVGTVTVMAVQGGDNTFGIAANVTRSFEVTNTNQTISFVDISNKFVTSVPFTANATASSGLPVTLTIVSGPATISSNIITLTGQAGTVIVRATQAGNIQYGPAAEVTRTFEVQKLSQSLSFAAIPDKLTTDAPFALDANTTSNLSIAFSVVSGPATVVGNTVTLTGSAGTVTIKAIQSGNNQYLASNEIMQSFVVSQVAQTVSFASIADQLANNPPFAVTASASSGLAISFSIISGPATVIGNTVTLTGNLGTVTIRARQLGNNQYAPATDVIRTFDVLQGTQSITFAALNNKLTIDAPFNISASASSGLATSFQVVSGPATISGNTVTLQGIEGTVVIKASQTGNVLYSAATEVIRSFNVVKATQSITFNTIPTKFTIDPPFSLEELASSNLSILYNVVSGPATVSGNIVTLTGLPGIVTIAAQQLGNPQYFAAAEVIQTFQVVQQTQTISFSSLGDKLTIDVPFTIDATASSNLPIVFTVDAGPATISGSVVTLTGVVGQVVIRASQLGNIQYQAAPDKTRTFDVVLANQSITFSSLPDKITTDAPFLLSASANSGLPISYSVSSGPATVLDNVVTLSGVVGTVEIKASQLGNAQYNAANDKYRSFDVVAASQIITFGALPNKFTTDTPFDLSATSSSGLPITFEVVSGPATMVNNTITLIGIIGTVTIKAIQDGNNTYNAGAEVERSFEVIAAPQSIAFNPLPNKYTVDLPFNLQATSSSGLLVSFSIVSGPATIVNNTVTLLGEIGTVTIKATQLGNNTYAEAIEIIQSFEVLLTSQAILFEPLPDKFTTDLPFDLQASVSSGLPVTFTLLSGPASLSGNTSVTLAGIPGTVVISANQPGDNQYLPAIEVIRSFEVLCITADQDNDGICAGIDCNDFDPLLPALPGSDCDDGDPLTGNDEIQGDGCTCAGTVSTTQIIAEYGIVVSPNPTSHHFNIQSIARFYRARLLSVTGAQVWQRSYGAGSTNETIDMQTMAVGTYMLVLEYNEGVRAVVKVVKMN